jgi:hypothetical protein
VTVYATYAIVVASAAVSTTVVVPYSKTPIGLTDCRAPWLVYTVLYCTVLYCIVLYCTLLCRRDGTQYCRRGRSGAAPRGKRPRQVITQLNRERKAPLHQSTGGTTAGLCIQWPNSTMNTNMDMARHTNMRSQVR